MAKSNSSTEFDSKFVNQKRNNTKSDLIEITEDKLENILLKHLHKSQTINNWVTPMTLFLTILIVLLTSNFKDFIGIQKEEWKALFLITLIVSFIWFCITVFKALSCAKTTTIKYLIDQIKNSQE